MIVEFFKKVYTKAFLFWGVQAFAFIIIFFVLDEKTGGGFFSRLFSFLFCVLLGGGLAAYWAKKSEGDSVVAFRRGAGTFLMCVTLLLWSNNGYKPTYSSNSTSSSSGSSDCITCHWCGGRGEVGYAGESEAQVRRTGMGLGNPCITCNGDGCE